MHQTQAPHPSDSVNSSRLFLYALRVLCTSMQKVQGVKSTISAKYTTQLVLSHHHVHKPMAGTSHTQKPVQVMSTAKANYCIQLHWSFFSLSTRCTRCYDFPQTSKPIPVLVVNSYIIPSENLVPTCKLAYFVTSKENFPILLVPFNRSQGQRPPSMRHTLVPKSSWPVGQQTTENTQH